MAAPRYFEELDSAQAKIRYLVAIELRTMLLNILVTFTRKSLICLTILRNPRPRTLTNSVTSKSHYHYKLRIHRLVGMVWKQ